MRVGRVKVDVRKEIEDEEKERKREIGGWVGYRG